GAGRGVADLRVVVDPDPLCGGLLLGGQRGLDGFAPCVRRGGTVVVADLARAPSGHAAPGLRRLVLESRRTGVPAVALASSSWSARAATAASVPTATAAAIPALALVPLLRRVPARAAFAAGGFGHGRQRIGAEKWRRGPCGPLQRAKSGGVLLSQ